MLLISFEILLLWRLCFRIYLWSGASYWYKLNFFPNLQGSGACAFDIGFISNFGYSSMWYRKFCSEFACISSVLRMVEERCYLGSDLKPRLCLVLLSVWAGWFVELEAFEKYTGLGWASLSPL